MENKKVMKEFDDKDFYQDEDVLMKEPVKEVHSKPKKMEKVIDSILEDTEELPKEESSSEEEIIHKTVTLVKKEKEPFYRKVGEKINEVQEYVTNKIFKNHYIEFANLLIIDILFFVCFLILGGILLFSSFSVKDEMVVSYQEASNLDYKVYLKPNDFYEEEFLRKDMIYVASLIDNINIAFDYHFTSSTEMDMDFSYKILADLEITNTDGSRSFFTKQYVLLNQQTLNMKDNNHQDISEKVEIDYGHYNSLANKFKVTYGVDTSSKLTVYMVVSKKNPDGSHYTLNEEKKTSVTIPLSQKAIDIQVPYSDINNANSFLQTKQSVVRNYFFLVLSILFFICSVYPLVLMIKKLLLIGPKYSAYDAYVNKILKEYDRLIVESDTLPSFEGKTIMKVRKFTELLDVHDNLQLPIIQYTITKHHKCYFYISYKDIIYLYVLKAVDLEADKNEKKDKKESI